MVITLLNNSDGFSDKQMKTLNSVLITEKNRLKNRTKQIELPLKVSSSIKDASGVVSGSQSYQYCGYLFQVFYLDAGSLILRKKTKLFTLNGNVKVGKIIGNSSLPAIQTDEAGVFLEFEFEKDTVYVTKIFNTTKQFKLVLTAIMET